MHRATDPRTTAQRQTDHQTTATRLAAKLGRAAVGAVVVLTALCSARPLQAQSVPRILSEETRLTNRANNAYGFGDSLAIDGDTLVVGAPRPAGNGIQRGVVCVYTRTAGTWLLQQTLTRTFGFGFGSDVAVSGNTLVVATEYSGSSLNQRPLVFVRNGAWTQQGELAHSGLAIGGERVAVAGDIAVVGTRDGGVYVFARSGVVWTQQTELRSEGPAFAPFALDGDSILLGEPSASVGGNANQGAAHLYVREGSTWTEQATLTAGSGQAGDAFGGIVALHGDTALVAGGRRIYEFKRAGGVWLEQQLLERPQLPDSLGNATPWSVTLRGDTAVVVYGTSAPYSVSFLYRRIGGRWYKAAQVHPASSSFTPAGVAVQGNQVFIGFSQFGNTSSFPSSLAAFPGVVFIYAAPTGLPPATPTLSGSVSGRTVSLSWTPGSGEAATSYILEAGTFPRQSNVFNADVGNVLQLTTAAPPGIYYVRVRGVNAMGAGDASNEVELGVGITLPPKAPTQLAATVTGTTVNFSWNPPSGGAVSEYILWASLTPGGVPIATMPLGLTLSASVPDVPPGTYYVFVQARNGLSASVASNVVSVTVAPPTLPGAPTLQTPTVNGSTVTLSWSPGPGGSPTSYTLVARASPGGAPLEVVPLTGTSASFTNVPSGTYYLTLTASNAAGTSSPSTPVTVVVGTIATDEGR